MSPRRRHLVLLVIIYIGFISLGLPDTVLGVAWDSMREELDQPVYFAGFLATLLTICSAVSAFFSGTILRRIGTGRLLMICGFVTGCSLLGYAFSPAFWCLLLFAIPLGFGQGAVDTGMNYYVARYYTSRDMSWLHCCWGIGASCGPTLMTLILASIILVAVGLKGPAGMVSALIIGGVVCTALSMAGGFITDLKIGYWLGSTPAKQETWKFLGTLVSAATVGGVILILNQTYGFTTGQLAAPQANAMAAVIEPLMSGSGAPWALYAIGAVLAVVLNFCKIPALAFALGMFIPLDLNTPLLIGGAISWYVGSRSKDQSLNSARLEKGTLLASGFIAGGALMGVVSAALRFGGINLMNEEWASSNAAEILAVVMYLVMIAYLTFNSLNAKKE